MDREVTFTIAITKRVYLQKVLWTGEFGESDIIKGVEGAVFAMADGKEYAHKFSCDFAVATTHDALPDFLPGSEVLSSHVTQWALERLGEATVQRLKVEARAGLEDMFVPVVRLDLADR